MAFLTRRSEQQGAVVGTGVGTPGAAVGAALGLTVGAVLGTTVGTGLGTAVGAAVAVPVSANGATALPSFPLVTNVTVSSKITTVAPSWNPKLSVSAPVLE